MSTTFNPARSAALRRQLGALPTTDLQPSTDLRQHQGQPTEQLGQPDQSDQSDQSGQSERPATGRHRRAPWVIGGAGLAVTVGLLASGPFQPASTTGADFIPAMARSQQPQDLLPEGLRQGDLDRPPGLVVDTSRLVGTERGYNYYAAESNDGMMCLVIAYPPEPPDPEAPKSPWEVACTPLTNFDSSPLQITSGSTNTKIWLVSANIEPTEEQLTQQTRLSPNLYSEYTDGIPLSPAQEAGHDL